MEEERPIFDPLTFFPNLTPELLAENREWLQPKALDPETGKPMLCIQFRFIALSHREPPHSHSMVAGGLPLMS